MKKYFLIAVVGLLLLTGCGSKQVVCSADLSKSGVSLNVSLIGELDSSNKISKVSYEYKFNDSATAEQYCSIVKLSYSDAECKGNKIIIPDATKMLEEQMDKSVIGMTKEEFIAFAKEDDTTGVTCK